MIEGGTAGGSALQQAAQRRATAQKLLIEAEWLESGAAAERLMGQYLAALPPAYAILHDLRVPGSKGNIDHVVIGPGGAFLVVTKRYNTPLVFRNGELWLGTQTMKPEMDAAKVEAQLLTQQLGTPVVPVISLLETSLPAATPHALDGVLVCLAENAARVITRGSHTLLASHRIADVVEVAKPLLYDPAMVVRTLSSTGVGPDPEPDPTVTAILPKSTYELAAERTVVNKKSSRAGSKAARIASRPAKPTRADRKGKGKRLVEAAEPSQPASARRQTFRIVLAAIISLSVTGYAAGAVIRSLGGDKVSVPPTTMELRGPIIEAGTTTLPLASGVPAPTISYQPVCPAPGSGWQLLPAWPGDYTGLAGYLFELQQPDGSWLQTAMIPNAFEIPGGSLLGQGPNVSLVVRITAAMADGSHSPSSIAVLTTPATPC